MITSMMCSTMTTRNAGLVDLAHQRDRLLQLGGRQARERLVEQHQARRRRQHARDLEPLAAGRAERARALVQRAGSARPVRARPWRARAHRSAVRMAQERADHHVVEHRHVLERRRHLEGAPDAGRACSSGDARVTSLPSNIIRPVVGTCRRRGN